MQIGWIDFSKTERDKVLSVLDLLGEKGVLDELGISPIRDAFSNRFFPGTSTIQTRAKYFCIVPYAFKDLELNNKIYPITPKNLDDIENETAKKILENNPDASGIIGINAIKSNDWVKRPPSSIYWAGLRRYGIFNANHTISKYLKFLNNQKLGIRNAKRLTNLNDNNENLDDKNAGVNSKLHFFNIPTYKNDWMDKIDINLTFEEGQFLKNQIISNCNDSMMAYILENDMQEIVEINYFSDLKSIIHRFPEKIQDDYKLALDFSNFNYVLNVVYNKEAFDGKNNKANDEFTKIKRKIDDICDIDINFIMYELDVKNQYLKNFLIKSKEFMMAEDFEGLKNHIKDREIFLKGQNRSRLFNPGKYKEDIWFAGTFLDYRFKNAKVIMEDIFESEKIQERYNDKSK